MYFLENKISGYTAKMPQKIILDGRWKCGLAEIHYSLTFYNVVNNELAIRKAVAETTTPAYHSHRSLRKGDVTEMVNKFIDDTEAKITINIHTGKATCGYGAPSAFHDSSFIYDFLCQRRFGLP